MDGTKHSFICTGSNLNQRTFNDEESLTSLQSTVLAGQSAGQNYTLEDNNDDDDNDDDDKDDYRHLTTVNEEHFGAQTTLNGSSASLLEDSNILNINMDAISDEEVFYDCSSRTPRDGGSAATPYGLSSPKDGLEKASPIFRFPSQLDFSEPDSGVSELYTGALLARDFHHLSAHAQSTPKVETSSGIDSDEASCSRASSARSPGAKAGARPGAQSAKKRLGFRERSASPAAQPSGNPRLRSPSLLNATCRVAEMKKLFEKPAGAAGRRSPAARSSKLPQTAGRGPGQPVAGKAAKAKSPARRSLDKSRPAKAKSPSYYTLENSKLLKSKALRSREQAAGSAKRRLEPSPRRAKEAQLRSYRSSSCSDCTTGSSSTSSVYSKDSLNGTASLRHSRCKSASDVVKTPASKPRATPRQVDFVTLRKNPPASDRVNSRVLPKKPTPKNQKKGSAIMNRKSLGYVSSPIKPVKELRQVFSPHQRQQSWGEGQKRLLLIGARKQVPSIYVEYA